MYGIRLPFKHTNIIFKREYCAVCGLAYCLACGLFGRAETKNAAIWRPRRRVQARLRRGFRRFYGKIAPILLLLRDEANQSSAPVIRRSLQKCRKTDFLIFSGFFSFCADMQIRGNLTFAGKSSAGRR